MIALCVAAVVVALLFVANVLFAVRTARGHKRNRVMSAALKRSYDELARERVLLRRAYANTNARDLAS